MISFEDHKNINKVCREFLITNYHINNDGTIDVFQDVILSRMKIKNLPIKFNNIDGSFFCNDCGLETLEGCPKIVKGRFNCDFNKLTTLKGGPEEAQEIYSCSYNRLKNLIGSPKYFNGEFHCNDNKLETLEGCPIQITEELECSNNLLKSLEGCPNDVPIINCQYNQIYLIDGLPEECQVVNAFENPIWDIMLLFSANYQEFKKSITDYNFIRGNKIIKSRFKEALDEYKINLPIQINGYEYI